MLRWIADDLGIPEPSPAELFVYILEALGIAIASLVVLDLWLAL